MRTLLIWLSVCAAVLVMLSPSWADNRQDRVRCLREARLKEKACEDKCRQSYPDIGQNVEYSNCMRMSTCGSDHSEEVRYCRDLYPREND